MQDDEVFAGQVKADLAKRRRAGLSEAGSNHYLQAAKQFCGWCRTRRYLRANPLDKLDPVRLVNPKRQPAADHRRVPAAGHVPGRFGPLRSPGWSA